MVPGMTVALRPARATISPASSYHEQWPPPATWTTPATGSLASATSAGARCPVNVGHPTWSSTTVELIAFGGEPQDRGRKAGSGGAEQPRRAHDRVTVGSRLGDRALARELRAAVRRRRPDRVGLDVRAALGAVEHVVAGDVDRPRPLRPGGARDVPAPGPLTASARDSSASAPSTSVHAAQLTTTSGRCSAMAACDGAAVGDVELGAGEPDQARGPRPWPRSARLGPASRRRL